MKYLLLALFALSTSVWAAEGITLVPKPQIVNLAGDSGPAGLVKVEYDGQVLSPQAQALLVFFNHSLPHGQMPYEGYLLKVDATGALIVAKDKTGEIYGRQTLDQLRRPDGTYNYATIADWPRQTWRGLHVLDSGPASLPAIKDMMANSLVKNRCNILIYEIDYNFAFKTHPEIKPEANGAWTKEQVRELVQAGKDNGIQVVPEINCLGHQSWLVPPGPLLKAHPELEEPLDATRDQTNLSSSHFYCRSWCPSNPQVNKIMFDLFGELLDAFQTSMFHVGMDEVFAIASQDCPRCKGKDPAQLYANQVLAFHQFFALRHVTMLMWGDRLLNKMATGYSEFESSDNGTDKALDLIPTDIILCDWHYEYKPVYPSLGLFTSKGHRVWPTIFKDIDAAKQFMASAQAMHSPLVLGTLGSVWIPAARLADALKPDFTADTADKSADKEKASTVVKSLQLMWNPVE